jgi:REP element-mobilizing transposase RayT
MGGATMARKPRLFIPYATYHVYCRIARGEFIFANRDDSELFLETLCDVKDRDGLSILAWCLMTNHYHLVLRTRSVPLWRTMARLQRTVATRHNRRKRYLGRLWQSRYRARFIDSNEYFKQVVAYVHLNPVAAGLASDPADYRLSGHREAIGCTPPKILDTPSLLELFDEEEPSMMRKAYLDWVRSVAEAKWIGQELRELPWWREAKDEEEIVPPSAHLPVETHDQRRLVEDRPPLDLSQIVRAFCEITGVDPIELRSRRKHGAIARARLDLTAIAIGRFDHRVCDLANLLSKNPGSVSRWLTIVDRRLASEPSYRPELDQLEKRLTEKALEIVGL